MADGSETFVGTVSNYNPEKGWGFIASEDAKALFGKDVFLLRKALGGFCPQVGDQVQFTAMIGERGDPEAASVQPLGAQPPGGSPQAVAENGTYHGALASWNPERGFGFISSAETTALYGKDVFVMKSEFGMNAGGVSQGVQLTFKVKNEQRGPVAYEVRPLHGGAAGMPPPGGGPQAVAEPGTYHGALASWNPERGFGFISSAETTALYGKDVFVMKSEFGMNAGAVAQGAQLTFKVKDEQRGPVAYEVKLGGGNPYMQPPIRGRSNFGPPQQGAFGPMRTAGHGGPPQRGAQAGAGGQLAAGENTVFFGTLKNLNTEKGWGHIGCQATEKIYGKDMFALRTAFDGIIVNPGDLVAFSVQNGPKGPHAVKLRHIDVSPKAPFNGTVKNFNAQKGWGFCDSPESQQAYGVDVFMHQREFAPGMTTPSAGDAVQFTVNITNGRPVANEIQPLGLGPPTAENMRFAPY